jgi:hypothetical protein
LQSLLGGALPLNEINVALGALTDELLQVRHTFELSVMHLNLRLGALTDELLQARHSFLARFLSVVLDTSQPGQLADELLQVNLALI